MALAYRSSGAYTEANSTSSGSIGLPAGLANGDILILPVQARGTAGTVATPSGYTRAGEINITASHRLVVFYKYVANAAGEAAPTVTQTVSGAIRARLSAFSGGSSTTQLDVDAVFAKSTDNATVTAPTATPISQGAMAVWIFSTGDDNTLNAATQGTTAYSSDGTLGADGSLALVYELQTNATAVGTCSMTESVNGPDNWNTATLILRPAPVAASNPSRTLYPGVTYALEAAFGASPFAPDPTWTDISAYVRLADGIQVTRGRNSEFSDCQPGTMSFTLDNRGRVFDPDYAAGTYFGQLLPQTRCRLRVRHNSVNYPIFDGYIQGWPQSYQYPREAVVQVRCVDLFSRLATRRLPTSLLALEILADGPEVYCPMDEETVGQISELAGNGWIGRYPPDVESVDSPIPGMANTKAKYRTMVGGPQWDGTILNLSTGSTPENVLSLEAWVTISAFDSATVAVSGTVVPFALSAVGVSNGLTLRADVVQTEGARQFYWTAYSIDATGTSLVGWTATYILGRCHHVALVMSSTFSTLTIYLDGQPIGASQISGNVYEGGSLEPYLFAQLAAESAATIAHVATYTTELSADDVLARYNAGLTGGHLQPAADRLTTLADFAGLVDAGLYDDDDLNPRSTYLNTSPPDGNALAAMQSIVNTERGRLFTSSSGVLTVQGRTADMGELTVNGTSQATVADSGSYAYADVVVDPNELELVKNAVYLTVAGSTVVLRDDDSISRFDEQEDSLTGLWSSPVAARAMGQARLRRYSEPTTRIQQVTLIPDTSTDVRYPLVFGVELGWRATVERTPQGIGSAISETVTVEGINLNFNEGRMVADLYLVPAEDNYATHPWFRIGDATYGRIGAAAGNHIPA